MKLLRAFVFLFFAGIATGNAQSVVHFSLYEMNPLYVNPAKSGDFLGTVRVGGLYREQWGFSSITTPFAYFDSPILNGFRKKKDDWVGIGAIFYKDVAGLGNLPTLGYYLSAAYHLDLGDKKTRRILTLGAQWGQETLGNGFDVSNFDFADGYNSISNDFDNTAETGGTAAQGSGQGAGQSGGKNAINAGVVFKTNKRNSKEYFEAGFSVSNINSLVGNNFVKRGLSVVTDTSSVGGGINPAPTGADTRVPGYFSGHVFMKRALIENELYLEPTAFIKVSNVFHQYNVHGWLAMNLKDKETEQVKDQVLKFGLGYRYTNINGVATPKVLLGYETSKMKVAFAYDMYIGKVLENRYAFELAANYIISSQPKVELPSKIYCPQL
jgi:type IX secretion system PorP/SprF family membrane protein